VDVLERDHLDRRVHVAQRDRDDAGRDAAARDVHRVGVRARVARRGLDRERDAGLLTRRVQELEDLRVEGGAAAEHGAGAELVRAQLLLLRARRVRGERDVHDDRDVGAERVGGRARAGERDLLLRDGDARDVAGRAAGLGHQARRLERHEAAEPVVERAGDEPAVRVLERLAGDHGDVADPHERAGLVAVLRADVDVQVAQLRHLLALLVAQQVDRLLADHAGHDAVARGHLDALADQDHGIPAADTPEPQEAVVVDVVDDQPDLVDMADHGQQRPAGRALHARDGRADRVVRHVGERRGRLAVHRGGGLLVAGRARRGQQLAEDLGDGHKPRKLSGSPVSRRNPTCWRTGAGRRCAPAIWRGTRARTRVERRLRILGARGHVRADLVAEQLESDARPDVAMRLPALTQEPVVLAEPRERGPPLLLRLGVDFLRRDEDAALARLRGSSGTRWRATPPAGGAGP
jgi:hypothetical protein